MTRKLNWPKHHLANFSKNFISFINEISKKTGWCSLVDNRPSTTSLKKKIDLWLVMFEAWHATPDTWQVGRGEPSFKISLLQNCATAELDYCRIALLQNWTTAELHYCRIALLQNYTTAELHYCNISVVHYCRSAGALGWYYSMGGGRGNM